MIVENAVWKRGSEGAMEYWWSAGLQPGAVCQKNGKAQRKDKMMQQQNALPMIRAIAARYPCFSMSLRGSEKEHAWTPNESHRGVQLSSLLCALASLRLCVSSSCSFIHQKKVIYLSRLFLLFGFIRKCLRFRIISDSFR
jgi:hypothetical protein